MSENNNSDQKTTQIEDSVLTEVESFNQAIAAKNSAIKKRDETILFLKEQLGEREKIISDYVEKLDGERSLRIQAESKIVDKKELDKKAIYSKPKSEDEIFAEKYQKAKEKLMR